MSKSWWILFLSSSSSCVCHSMTAHVSTYSHSTSQSNSKCWRGMKLRSFIFYTAGANVIHLWARLQEHRVLALTTSASSRQRQMRRMRGMAAWGAECKARKYLRVLHWKLSGLSRPVLGTMSGTIMLDHCSYCCKTSIGSTQKFSVCAQPSWLDGTAAGHIKATYKGSYAWAFLFSDM